MAFRRASFFSFRNLQDAEIDIDAERVFLVGENGQGKTNFLEALYYLCYGSSFRGHQDSLIPREGADGFSLKGAWTGSSSGGYLDEEISIRVDGGVKDIKLNGKTLKDRKDLVFHNPAVVFCHEDFSFAAGDPERRRFFFDQCAGMLSLSYIETLRSYKKVLKQRNAALKEGMTELLEALDPQYVRYGLDLMTERAKIHGIFQKIFPELFEQVSRLGRRVDLEYQPNWPISVKYEEALVLVEARREGDLQLGTTRSGPHRDKWNFLQGKELFTETASTGQLRLISLILRIVEARSHAAYAKTTLGGPAWPVLLLDDVLLELDVGKRRRFLELLPGKGDGAQSFFTFLPEEPWTEYASRDTIVYKVSDGRFQDQTRL